MSSWRRFLPDLDDALMVPGVACLAVGVGGLFGVWCALIVVGMFGVVGGVMIGRPSS